MAMLLAGGVSGSASSTASSGSGDIGGSSFTFGGINTGKQSTNSVGAIVAVVLVVALGLIVYAISRK